MNMNIKTKRKGCILFSTVGIFFFFFLFSCSELAKEGNIIWNTSWSISLLGKSVLSGILLGMGLFLGLSYLKEKLPMGGVNTNNNKSSKVFLLSYACIILCWFPTWLAYYPGICSYDTPVQMEQILYKAYNTHHPLAHTLLLEVFYRLGELVGNVNLGIAIGTLLQMLLIGSALAGCIALLARQNVKKWQLVLLTIFSAVFPVNWYMSVTTTKDVLFTLFVLLFFVLFYGILQHTEGRGIFLHLCFIISAVGIVLFRNNGKYALLLFWLCFAAGLCVSLIKKTAFKTWKILFVDTAAGLVIGFVLLSGLSGLTNAREGDKREMLSLPIQQLARTMVYHGGVGVLPEDDNTMKAQDKALIQEFLLNESYKNYRPVISDPVKSWTNTYVVRYKPVEFAKTYLRLFADYPGDFVNAALAINAGWLSPADISHATINQNVSAKGHGYIQTGWSTQMESTGLYPDSKFPLLHEKLESFADHNGYLELLGLNILVAPGIYLWCYLFLAAWLITFRRYKELLPFFWIFGYFGTLLLGPAVQLRYLYPLMVILPFVWIMLCTTAKRT